MYTIKELRLLKTLGTRFLAQSLNGSLILVTVALQTSLMWLWWREEDKETWELRFKQLWIWKRLKVTPAS